MVNLNWQPGMTLETLEEHAIKQAFRFYQGNKSATSRALDISVRTLESKLEKYESAERDNIDRTERQRKLDSNLLARQRGHVVPHPELEPVAGTSGEARGQEVPPNGDRPGEGSHLQPAEESSEEFAVSVPVRKEVQGVPPKQAAGGGVGKRR